MKLLIGVLLLLVTFVAAAMWQRSWRADAHAERERARSSGTGLASPEPGARAEGWGRVIIGRPSGVDPEPPYAERPPAQVPTPPSSALPGSTPAKKNGARATPAEPSPSAGEERIVVRSGDSLSSVCQSHYGTSRQDVVQALALYNEMKDPNGLREGQTLKLPPLEKLVGKTRP